VVAASLESQSAVEAVRVGPLLARHFLEVSMKMILAAALALGLCGLAGAADKADPVGTWKCEYKIGDQKRTSELTIKKDGDKLAGTMNWPDQKDEKLKDVKLKDGTLTFSAVRKFMGNEIAIEYKLTIDGDKLKGKGTSEVGDRKQEFDIEGKREKKDK
jgi:major membrane immunogen (membrane-anchored lipoprotein)